LPFIDTNVLDYGMKRTTHESRPRQRGILPGIEVRVDARELGPDEMQTARRELRR